MTPAHVIHSIGVERAEQAGRLWREDAACKDHDIDLWFPVSEQGKGAPDASMAKAICAVCPVKAPCLDYALTAGEREGIWGGATPEERRGIKAERRAVVRAQRICAWPECRRRFTLRNANQRYCGPDCLRASRAVNKRLIRRRARAS